MGIAAGGDLTDAEILGRRVPRALRLQRADPADEAVVDEYEQWCSEESPMFDALEAGTALADLDTAGITDPEGAPIQIIDIGDAPSRAARPRCASPADGLVSDSHDVALVA